VSEFAISPPRRYITGSLGPSGLEAFFHLAVPMSEPTSRSTGDPAPDQRLTDRVIARLKDAHRAVSASSRPGLGKGRRRRVNDTDTRALRRVFLDFGDSYRSYRQRTGEPVSPEVKEAALRFRRELDLPSLVWVAASLERLDHDMVG
jgi:hypothetical protein